jgi:hypothetical protein
MELLLLGLLLMELLLLGLLMVLVVELLVMLLLLLLLLLSIILLSTLLLVVLWWRLPLRVRRWRADDLDRFGRERLPRGARRRGRTRRFDVSCRKLPEPRTPRLDLCRLDTLGRERALNIGKRRAIGMAVGCGCDGGGGGGSGGGVGIVSRCGGSGVVAEVRREPRELADPLLERRRNDRSAARGAWVHQRVVPINVVAATARR